MQARRVVIAETSSTATVVVEERHYGKEPVQTPQASSLSERFAMRSFQSQQVILTSHNDNNTEKSNQQSPNNNNNNTRSRLLRSKQLPRLNINEQALIETTTSTTITSEQCTLSQAHTLPAVQRVGRRRRPVMKLNLPSELPNSPCGSPNAASFSPNGTPSKFCRFLMNPNQPKYTQSAPVGGKAAQLAPTDSGYASAIASPRYHSLSTNPEHNGVKVQANLFISGESDAREPNFIKTHQITAIVSIQLKELPANVQKLVKNYKHICISDTVNVNIMEYFPEVIDFIDANKRTLVHCQAGISRSATLCLAYLIQKQRMTLDCAFNHLKAQRKCIGPNFSFLGQLKSWEEKQLAQAPTPLKSQNSNGESAPSSAASSATTSPNNTCEKFKMETIVNKMSASSLK